MESETERALVLLTGATGYVGGRLLNRLTVGPWRVRCLARRPEALGSQNSKIEIARGDVLDFESLRAALLGVDVAYYLVHSLGVSSKFEDEEKRGAENFSRAARDANIKRIVFLGGLAPDAPDLSPHLRSRHEVGRILAASGVPTLELRASIIIGSGSLSFEMIRALVDRLPVMITPRWVRVPTQPIHINDVISYLVESIGIPLAQSRVFEIGGRDVVSYQDIMMEYARQRGLRRFMIPVPFLTPRLSSLWLGLVTPIYTRVGRKLIDGIRSPTIITDDSALREFSVRPIGLADSIRLALRNEDEDYAATRWSDALSAGSMPQTWGGVRFGNRLVDSRSVHVPVSPAQAFAPIRQIGGRQGWYHANYLWKIRGGLDLLVGGIGVRRGRRHPDQLAVGDALDFWRVETFEPDSLLRLSAEMKLPGRAWLQFEVTPDATGSTIRQTAIFDPIGLPGILYWYATWPLHQYVMAGMLNQIAHHATTRNHEKP